MVIMAVDILVQAAALEVNIQDMQVQAQVAIQAQVVIPMRPPQAVVAVLEDINTHQHMVVVEVEVLDYMVGTEVVRLTTMVMVGIIGLLVIIKAMVEWVLILLVYLVAAQAVAEVLVAKTVGLEKILNGVIQKEEVQWAIQVHEVATAVAVVALAVVVGLMVVAVEQVVFESSGLEIVDNSQIIIAVMQ
jgi:hypothetical protein